jgi:hypothetical protein
MAEPQLSVRSARARALARRLAKKERRSISQVVERALELYAKAEVLAKRETASEFWDRMTRDYATDIDLEAIIEEHRKPHKGIDL